MPDLVPVDENPFHIKLEPVDENPWANAVQGDFGAASQQLLAQEAQRRGVLGNVMQHFTLPGRLAQGVQPDTPGMMTETDAFRQNQLNDEAMNFGPSQAMNMIGSGMPMAEKMALGAGGGAIKAYHGSPHDFDAFDMSKIGTGEGAQAYGHGLYFAENPKTAEEYRKSLGDWHIGDKPADPLNPHHVAAATLAEYGGDKAAAIHDLTVPYREVMKGLLPPEEARVAAQATELLKSGAELPNARKGRMYEVNINADPEHFLDWDKPLSEQHPAVTEKLSNIVKDRNRTAAEWINSSPGAEERLREAGIPGIKYLDQGSRNLGDVQELQSKVSRLQSALKNMPESDPLHASTTSALTDYQNRLAAAQRGGTSNYVVFHHDIVDILKKYGLAGLVAGGAAHFKTTPVQHDPFAAQQ